MPEAATINTALIRGVFTQSHISNSQRRSRRGACRLNELCEANCPVYAQCLIEVAVFHVEGEVEPWHLATTSSFLLFSLVYIDYRYITDFREREAQHPTLPCSFHVVSQCHYDIYRIPRRYVYPHMVLCPVVCWMLYGIYHHHLTPF